MVSIASLYTRQPTVHLCPRARAFAYRAPTWKRERGRIRRMISGQLGRRSVDRGLLGKAVMSDTLTKQPFGYPGRCHPILGGNVDARHHCYLCRLGGSIDHFGASRSLASKQSRSNRTHCLPYRASGKRMRVRISALHLAGSVGPLALGPLHFEDAQESISRKHGELAASAT